MRKSTTLYAALISALTLAALHFLANAFYFYWIYWWYDVMMHFLGGVTIGLAAYWTLFDSGLFLKRESTRALVPILTVLLSVMAVGAGWEIFEYSNGITDSHEGYKLDTMNDLILDGSGSVLAALVGLRKKKRNG